MSQVIGIDNIEKFFGIDCACVLRHVTIVEYTVFCLNQPPLADHGICELMKNIPFYYLTFCSIKGHCIDFKLNLC